MDNENQPADSVETDAKTTEAPLLDQAAPAQADCEPAPKPRFLIEPETGHPYSLKYPLEWNGEGYHTVTFYPLKGADIDKIVRSDGDELMAFQLITGLPREILEAMHVADLVEIADRCAAFVPVKFKEG